MAIMVDTNVILDVSSQDPIWSEWSREALARNAGEEFLANAMVYAELCCNAHSSSEVDSLLDALNIQLSEMPREALFQASKAHLAYRSRGGTRRSGLPDFFIGAHAQVLGIPILTRDQARYKTYFPEVPLICP